MPALTSAFWIVWCAVIGIALSVVAFDAVIFLYFCSWRRSLKEWWEQ